MIAKAMKKTKPMKKILEPVYEDEADKDGTASNAMQPTNIKSSIIWRAKGGRRLRYGELSEDKDARRGSRDRVARALTTDHRRDRTMNPKKNHDKNVASEVSI